MLKRVKRWLGIEGVKLELLVPEELNSRDGKINGRIRLTSLETQQVTLIRVVLIEKYARGRKKDKLIDEYKLGETTVKEQIEVPAEESVEIDFTLDFSVAKSDMDEWGDKNFITSGLLKAMKWAEGVRSEFRIEAEAKVTGVALNPFDKKNIQIK